MCIRDSSMGGRERSNYKLSQGGARSTPCSIRQVTLLCYPNLHQEQDPHLCAHSTAQHEYSSPTRHRTRYPRCAVVGTMRWWNKMKIQRKAFAEPADSCPEPLHAAARSVGFSRRPLCMLTLVEPPAARRGEGRVSRCRTLGTARARYTSQRAIASGSD